MRLRFTTCMVGGDFVRNAGDIADVPDAQAARLIEAGFAEVVREPEQIETATLPTPKLETATVRGTRKAKGKGK